ncbi:putative quinol monooxygenase [Labrys wisconsinensis]|uniref:Quinol monooxygenase YgiN n=1 Tax=Labrys wisconsinensis TaxID=425677 RepID=A0ABU0JEL0_9HYPH|nr:putative quinol monooxygenase [Labrys wisconsinensis]MDQ0471946.1 quinol monooxygenase YgiN [Labrys wisconsinensis]
MIHVIATITAKPGHRDAVLAHFRANMPAVRAEKGCIEYTPVVDVANGGSSQTALGPDTFMVIEKWQTIDDLAAHAASSHMAAYAAKVKDLLAARTIRVLTAAVEA